MFWGPYSLFLSNSIRRSWWPLISALFGVPYFMFSISVNFWFVLRSKHHVDSLDFDWPPFACTCAFGVFHSLSERRRFQSFLLQTWALIGILCEEQLHPHNVSSRLRWSSSWGRSQVQRKEEGLVCFCYHVRAKTCILVACLVLVYVHLDVYSPGHPYSLWSCYRQCAFSSFGRCYGPEQRWVSYLLRGVFKFAILQFSWCPWICHKLSSCSQILMPFVLFDTE